LPDVEASDKPPITKQPEAGAPKKGDKSSSKK
jgi:hypothetical protein